MERRANPFLSVIAYPDGWSCDQVATLLHDAAGLDLPSLRLKLRQKPPMVYAQVEPQPADLAIRALRLNGGDGLAVTLTQLESLGPTQRIRDLRVETGSVVLEPWSGDVARIDPAEIAILIRATLAKSKVRSRSETAIGDAVDRRMLSSPTGGLWRVGGVEPGYRSPERRITTTDLLDIHLRDGRIFQIDGNRFSYQALGEMKGHADKQNMDCMRDLLGHLAPQAIVDDYFSLWRAPAGHQRLRRHRGGGNDDPSFAFYSRWTALVYRHASGATD